MRERGIMGRLKEGGDCWGEEKIYKGGETKIGSKWKEGKEKGNKILIRITNYWQQAVLQTQETQDSRDTIRKNNLSLV
ncbi:hypothetical protein LDENG_00247990 [Lucifuga dentata]|nr:hypothetical protein LDENG_00247990 [Lucifuga dentata]